MRFVGLGVVQEDKFCIFESTMAADGGVYNAGINTIVILLHKKGKMFWEHLYYPGLYSMVSISNFACAALRPPRKYM